MHLLSSTLLVAALAATAVAQSPLLVNGSFEVTNLPPGRHTLSVGEVGAIPGWTIAASSATPDARLDVLIELASMPSSDGRVAIHLGAFPRQAAALEQTIDTVVGGHYRLSFDLAGNYSGAPRTKRVEVSAGGHSQLFEFDSGLRNPLNMGWTESRLDFTATSETTLLRFDPLDVSFAALIDNVRVERTGTSPTVPPSGPTGPAGSGAVASVVDLGGPNCAGTALQLDASLPLLGDVLRIDVAGCNFSDNVLLASVGAPLPGLIDDCALWVDTATMFVITVGRAGVTGSVTLELPVPDFAALEGVSLTVQGLSNCWAGNVAGQHALSNGLQLTFGN